MTRVRSIVASVVAVGLLNTGIVALTATTASAVDCWAEMPQPTKGRWTWRLVDGRKCWYVGDPKLSRSELHWPDSSSTAKEASASPPADAMARASDADVAAARTQAPQAVLVPQPPDDAPASFQARWNGMSDRIR